MSQEEMIRRAKAAFEVESQRPAQEGLQRLIDKGVINEAGEVLFVHEDPKKATEEPKR